MSRNIVITGASRGLGFYMAREFLAQGDQVYALIRKASPAFLTLEQTYGPQVRWLPCDVSDTASVNAAAKKLAALIDHADILINNAGVNLDLGNVVDYTRTNFDDMAKTFAINTAGPMRVVQALVPLLKPGSLSVAISSGAGSITYSTEVEVEIAYRVSKAALNMAMRLYGNTVKKQGVRMLLVDPGWMHTDMGGPAAPCDPEENARLIVELLNRADAIPAERLFVNYKGEEVPW
jgi:NAD(P)-dependent dehydrogenase (short-subunit alcohol dehydrogenase family)